MQPGKKAAADMPNRAALLLDYAYAYVQMVVFSPFLHHTAKPIGERDQTASACVQKCGAAAALAVQAARELDRKGILEASHLLTVDVLAYAATISLVMELGSTDLAGWVKARKASKGAKSLLGTLAARSATASACLEALQVRSLPFRLPSPRASRS